MIAIFVALQIAPLAEMKSEMQPMSVDEGVALFQQICFDKFLDSDAVLNIVADPAMSLTKQLKTPTQAMQPGDVWTSPKARVTYVDAEWMPLDIGSPQCSVTVVLQGQPVHSEVAAAMTAALKLPDVKFGKNASNASTKWASTKWDLPQTNGDKWRLFLNISQTPSGTEMRTVIMNLRGKKKK